MPDYLTKSAVMSGLQCSKRLWMSKHDPLPRDELQPTIIQDMGTDVGKCAHNLFPGGQLVDAAPWEHEAAVAHTLELINNPDIPAIFEAAFEAESVRVRVDILERQPRGCWKLYEVKASTGTQRRAFAGYCNPDLGCEAGRKQNRFLEFAAYQQGLCARQKRHRLEKAV